MFLGISLTSLGLALTLGVSHVYSYFYAALSREIMAETQVAQGLQHYLNSFIKQFTL